jgi:xyloglucan fucosyltransferase
MEIFEVAKDKLGLGSKRYTTLLFACSVALPVSLMILIVYQNQLFHLTGGLAQAEKSRNVTALNVGKTPRPFLQLEFQVFCTDTARQLFS